MTSDTDAPLDPISTRLRAPDYRTWRAQVEASGGCAAPIHLTGSSRVLDRDGAVLIQREGEILASCGNRRATVCPACSDRYAGTPSTSSAPDWPETRPNASPPR
jgi:hypothetical protein